MVPQGGFFFVTELERTLVKCANLKGLVRKVADFHHSKNADVPKDLENEIVCQICYRNPAWCVQEISEGLGDTVSKITRRAGVAPMLARIQNIHMGTCTGCNSRKKRLNKAVPYRLR